MKKSLFTASIFLIIKMAYGTVVQLPSAEEIQTRLYTERYRQLAINTKLHEQLGGKTLEISEIKEIIFKAAQGYYQTISPDGSTPEGTSRRIFTIILSDDDYPEIIKNLINKKKL